MITDHVFRPTKISGHTPDPAAARARCAYMNCGRPRAEHRRAISGAPARAVTA